MPARKARTYRRLPAQSDWPFWLVIAVQIGILVGRHRPVAGGRGLRLDRRLLLVEAKRDLRDPDQILRRRRRLDRYRLHLPSTIFGFLLGTTCGSLLGLSFWWSRNYAASRAALHHLLRVAAEARAGAARDPGVRDRTRLQGRHRDRADADRVDADDLCGREGGRSAIRRGCSIRSAPAACRCSASWSCRSACPGSFRCCA